MSDRVDVTDVAPSCGDELEAPGSSPGLERWATVGRLFAGGVLVVTLASCGVVDDDSAAAGSSDSVAAVDVAGAIAPGLVTPAQAAEIAAGDVTVIDVRTPEEFAEGHLADATLIDFYADDFAARIAALPADEPYLVYCRSGNRSGQAVALMEELGFGTVYDMDGGIVAYAAEGLPLAP